MQNAIINAMKCTRSIKDRIARPASQLAIKSIEPLYHAQQVSRWKSSVRDLQDPSDHHSSVVFRHDNSVGHHSDDSVGLSGMTTQSASHNVALNHVINQSVRLNMPTDSIARITAMFTLQAIKVCSIRTSILKILPHRFLKCTTGLPGSWNLFQTSKINLIKHKSEPKYSNTYGQNYTQVLNNSTQVEIERATHKESSGTKITQIICGEQRLSTVIGHGEQ
ncbi:hypothetical protein F511_36570 [Dorcoceras hygrometricum]|uniref:Uncharacterized protein n=1 Tax=Dorcoceras hygrometricum TaxID=472368 RepID=A0A2Z7AAN3_9LAMI|nr:hypothetical protein F511_36570 [Dorcoceras hygrometricum]